MFGNTLGEHVVWKRIFASTSNACNQAMLFSSGGKFPILFSCKDAFRGKSVANDESKNPIKKDR